MLQHVMEPTLCRIAGEYPFKPHAYLRHYGVRQEAIDKYFRDRVEGLIDSGATLVQYGHDAAAIYRHSQFDTDILGLKTVKIDYALASSPHHGGLIQSLVTSLNTEQVEYATCRLSGHDAVLLDALEANSFRLVDGYLVLINNGTHIQSGMLGELASGLDVSIRTARASDIPALQETMAPTFVYSRFFRDSILSQSSAIQMHREWIRNAVLGRVAEAVFIAETDGTPVGFIAVEMERDASEYFGKRIGHIALIGTDPRYRGRHIALALTHHAFNGWFQSQGADLVRIETQLINVPATRTYENAGFRLVDSAFTMRWAKA